MQAKLTKDEWDELQKIREKYHYLFAYDLETAEDIDPKKDPIIKFINAINSFGNSLNAMARLGEVRAVELLLKAGADVHYNEGDMEFTPLHDAYQCENPDKRAQIVAMLLAYGASSDVRNGFGKKPGE